ncbi:MAG: IS66 family insertion sequence element accessory protein TnpB [Polyangiaceae bacterium]
MIPHGVEVFLGLEPVDLRWGFDRLAGAVSERVGREARSGALFVFFGRRRDAIKVLFFDGTGMCLFYKRLDRGTFRLPDATDLKAASITLDERALDDLLDGIDVDAKPRRAARKRIH